MLYYYMVHTDRMQEILLTQPRLRATSRWRKTMRTSPIPIMYLALQMKSIMSRRPSHTDSVTRWSTCRRLGILGLVRPMQLFAICYNMYVLIFSSTGSSRLRAICLPTACSYRKRAPWLFCECEDWRRTAHGTHLTNGLGERCQISRYL